MIDQHTHRDHRYEAARSTCDRYSPDRSYCIVPERAPVPASVKIITALILFAGAVFFFAPSALRIWL